MGRISPDRGRKGRLLTPSPGAMREAGGWGGRGARVVTLVVLTVLVSLADLYMTLVYATSVGLHEGNPLARAVMLYNCPWVVVAFRALTITLFAIVLIRVRAHRSAEIAAWSCALVMGWLMVRWHEYNAHTHELSTALAAVDEHGLTDFVTISSQDR